MSTNIIIGKGKGENKLWLPASARNSGNDPRFLPWRCTLPVQLNSNGDMKSTIYYARAEDPNKACVIAERWWTRWEKVELGLKGMKWPDVIDIGFAECIDENDWDNSWGAALKYNMQFRAVEDETEPGYPMLFTVIGHTDV